MKAALATVAGVLVVVALAVGGWQLHWYLAKSAVGHQYDINTGTQQYQAGLISQERNNVLAWNRAVDPGQKQAIADQFCAVYLNINPPPADLLNANVTICH